MSLGYKILYDEIDVENLITYFLWKVGRNKDYIMIRGGRRYRLALIAKLKAMKLDKNGGGGVGETK